MTQPTMRIRGAADLIAAVPYLLGFHPTDSLTVTALRDARVTFAMRADLPAAGAPVDVVAAHADQVVTAITRQDGITGVILVGYGPAARVTPAVDATRDALTAAGFAVRDALRVTDGRFWSYTCHDPACCPADGTPCHPDSSVLAAEATLAGMVALPSRTDLAAQIAAVDGDDRQRMSDATTRALYEMAALKPGADLTERGYAAVRQAHQCYEDGRALSDDEAAWLTILLQYQEVRDYAGALSSDHPSRLALWTDITRRAEPGLVAAPASLLAYTAWQHGNGALALLAVDRALDADPTYTLAHLIGEALQRSIPPSAVGSWPAERS
ncbi:DUF4192 domain-containing protein [Micromonospora coerulea]|uniref:DUF4192 domain-containing protein n=1 Tax=Micromonospora coerulea TaxID=47856 RepID=UPI0019087E06|nr:DUF4192 domain-containing protein [Micromonospora veneta]